MKNQLNLVFGKSAPRYPEEHLATPGELDGVAHQVEYDPCTNSARNRFSGAIECDSRFNVFEFDSLGLSRFSLDNLGHDGAEL